MTDLEKAIKLYSLMVERMEKFDYCKYQADIYLQIVELMKSCNTIEEATENIKMSPLYTAPAVALIKDRLYAKSMAAMAKHMPRLRDLYHSQIEKIEADESVTYDVGYEKSAMDIRADYIKVVDGFCSLYESYVVLSTISPFDDDEIQKELLSIEDLKQLFPYEDMSLGDFGNTPEFRAMILSNDPGFESFLHGIDNPHYIKEECGKQREAIAKEAEEAFSKAQSCKEEILTIGSENLRLAASSRVTVFPPSDEMGDYTFSDREVIR